jgi:hypothetical protein
MATGIGPADLKRLLDDTGAQPVEGPAGARVRRGAPAAGRQHPAQGARRDRPSSRLTARRRSSCTARTASETRAHEPRAGSKRSGSTRSSCSTTSPARPTGSPTGSRARARRPLCSTPAKPSTPTRRPTRSTRPPLTSARPSAAPDTASAWSSRLAASCLGACAAAPSGTPTRPPPQKASWNRDRARSGATPAPTRSCSLTERELKTMVVTTPSGCLVGVFHRENVAAQLGQAAR